jgi:hypothetical protein
MVNVVDFFSSVGGTGEGNAVAAPAAAFLGGASGIGLLGVHWG